MKIVVGTRGSKLALVQTNWVVDQLKKANPEIEFEVKIIKTKGDLVTHLPLHKIGDKGLFTKEIEQQLLDKEIDLAIHSMKDMPSSLPEGLKFASIPKREDPRDVLVLKEGYNDISDLPKGAKIGTGSKRRTYQLLKYRPDLEIVPIRGNVGTRLEKMKNEGMDGIILAAAGLKRLGMEDIITEYLNPEIFVPAVSQGALGIECLKNGEYNKYFRELDNKDVRVTVEAERSFMRELNGGCHSLIGAYATLDGNDIYIIGTYEVNGTIVKKDILGKKEDNIELGRKLAQKILKA